MGCATRNSKVVAISIGSFQRLISMRAVPQTSIPSIISVLSDSISQGVDIQLKILQTLLSLLTNFPDIHDDLLGDVCTYCYLFVNFTCLFIGFPCRHFYYASNYKTPALLLCRRLQQQPFVNWSCLYSIKLSLSKGKAQPQTFPQVRRILPTVS